MKTKPTNCKVFLLALLLCCIGKFSNAQTFNYYVSNDHLVSPTVFEFDVSIANTSGADFLFRTAQQCFTFNAAFINGATITASYVTGPPSTQMTNYSPGSITWSAAANGFQVAANTGVACSNGTIIPASGSPLRVATFRLTATSGAFGCAGSNPNMVMTGDVPAPSGLALRMAITKWNDNTCVLGTNTTITGPATQYTRFAAQTQYGQVGNNRPTITSQPTTTTACSGVSGHGGFSISAAGNGLANPLGYQWYENGVPLTDGIGANATYLGSQTSTLQISNPSASLNGFSYYCDVLQCSPSLSRSSVVVTLNVNNTNDSDPCTIDVCDPLTGNVSHQPVNADDNNVCTMDGCDPVTGIYHNPISVDDQNVCTTDGCDPVTGPFHTPISVDDNDACTTDGCDPAQGPYHNPISVDDNNVCTTDGCDPMSGAYHTPISVDDNDACTTDACDPVTGPSHTPINVDDGDVCTTDLCTSVYSSYTPMTYMTDPNDVSGLPFSWVSTGSTSATLPVSAFPPGSAISDVIVYVGLSHTWGGDIFLQLVAPGGATSNVLNQPSDPHQIFGTPPTPDAYVFQDGQAPLPNTGFTAVNVPSPGPYNPSAPLASLNGSNPNGMWTINVSDGVSGDNGTVGPLSLAITALVPNGTPTASITHTPISVDDNDACTTDACDPITGPSHTPISVDDNNVCTTDACDPITGPSHTPVNIDDNDACTTDACDPMSGISHTPVNVDDNNVCTTDACSNTPGVVTQTFSSATGLPISWTSTLNTTNATINVSGFGAGATITNVSMSVNLAHTWGGDVEMALGSPANSFFDVFFDPNDGNINWGSGIGVVPTLPYIFMDGGGALPTGGNVPVPSPGPYAPTQPFAGYIGQNPNGNWTLSVGDFVGGDGGTVENWELTISALVPGANITHTPISVDDNNVCTTDGCDPVTGPYHTPISVDDNNVCTTDGCNPITGPFHTPISVDDNNVCTTDGCNPITGPFHTPISVDDNNVCTTDGCNPVTGPFHTPISVDDNNVCTTDGCNPVTGPFHTPISVDDNNACTTDGCNPTSGPFHTPVNTNDNNACTTDACDPITGVSHTPVNTNDNNACTTDGCDPISGVFHNPVNTNDNNACTTDACDPATGAITHTPVNVDDNNVCTTDACNPSTGAITHTQINVNDNNVCTTDGCDPVTGPFHNPISVDDNNVCTTDACDPITGPSHTPISVNDNDACTTDACDPITGPSHTPVNTNDNNVCTTDGCDPATGVFHTPISVDDNNACTTDACDPITGPSHTPVNTNDNNACTTDACDPITGVSHTPVNTDDGNACTTDGCNPTSGVFHNPVNTNDNNACTTDACDPATGAITHTAVNVDDNNVCTTDACNTSTGAITHTPISVNDNNVCTTDGCDPVTGPFHTPISVDDNNVCTTDGCNPTSGPFHTPISVNDNDACTTDACDPITGPSHTPVNTNDNNACTTDGCDPATGVYHTPVSVTDNNPCTDDACDPSTGAISHTPNPVVPAASAGTIACNGGTTSVTVTATGGHTPYTGTGVFPGYGAGTYSFTVTDVNGCSADASVTITDPTKVLASTSVGACSGATATATAAGSGGTPAYTYHWSNGVNTAAAAGLTNGTYSVTVTDSHGCTATATAVVSCVSNTCPSAPGAISGPSGFCAGQCVTYSIAPVPGAVSYLWTLPSGVTGHSTGTSITVCASSNFCHSTPSGFICVKAVAPGCPNSASTCKSIKRYKNKPGMPSAITGPTTICRGACATYSIPSVTDATSYVWSVSGGLTISSGQGSTTVVVCAPSNCSSWGQVKVYAKNCKGNSSTKYKNVSVGSAPSQPGSISGNSPVCKSNTNKTYSISSCSGATSYIWTVTNGVVIASGQGTTSVKLNFPGATSSSTVLSVVAHNSCGNSTARTKTITINNCRMSDPSLSDGTDVITFSALTAYPNPTTGKTTVSFNADRDAKYSLKVIDMIGNVLVNENGAAVEGYNMKEINVEGLAQGLYFISVQTEGSEAKTLKLIVE